MEHPEPLVAANVDLRDFPFMPLDVVRLRDSDLAALEPREVCWTSVLLWCASWHQVPPASLPDDDRILAKLAGFGTEVKAWQRMREGALRGFVKCSDLRLYHPVVAEKANEAWRGKLEQRWRSECARHKKHNQRHGTSIACPDFEAWLSLGCPQGQPLPVPKDNGGKSPGTGGECPGSVPRETHSKGQGEGQGQGLGKDGARKRASRLPKPCDLASEWRAEAERILGELQRPDVVIDREWSKFCDHFWAQPGQKGVKDDWLATWRNWVRKACEFQRPPARAPQANVEALQAWNEVREANKQGSGRPARGWSFKHTDAALKDIGGFGRISDMRTDDVPFRQREFMDSYARAVQGTTH